MTANFALAAAVVLSTWTLATTSKANDVGALPPLPLATKGRFIIDASGKRFKLASVNWYGAHDFRMVPAGLDRLPLQTLVADIRAMGFNSVRLTFSNAMIHAPRFDPAAVAANPALAGKTPLEVFDAVIAELNRQGIAVIINNHTTHAIWCCGYEEDGLWHTHDVSEEDWIRDWVYLVARYRNVPGVVGVDLRNEVRIARDHFTWLPIIPNWGSGGNDWQAAAETAGNRVLATNPNVLVIVEGLNFPRDHLRGVRDHPVRLTRKDKLVYSAHSYGFIGPNFNGPHYRDMSADDLIKLLTDEWGFVAAEDQEFTAPVWVSEFGDGVDQTDRVWFERFIHYLGDGDFDFAYWSLNAGPRASGDPETFALLDPKTWRPLENDWRLAMLKGIMAPHFGASDSEEHGHVSTR